MGTRIWPPRHQRTVEMRYGHTEQRGANTPHEHEDSGTDDSYGIRRQSEGKAGSGKPAAS